MRYAALLAPLLLAPSLSACIAAVVPIAASTAIVRKQMDNKREQRAQSAPAPAPTTVTDDKGQKWTVAPGMKGLPAPDGSTPRPATPAAPVAAGTVPETRQYLYGSGESAGLSIQAYQALNRYLADHIAYRKKGSMRQVVLADGSTLSTPQFEPCGQKPPAIVLDIDETAVLNLGYEADAVRRGVGFDDSRWQRWEATGADKVVAVPGAKLAVDAARQLGITVIFNSNRTAASAAATTEALNHAGLGPVEHGTTLWLKGDDGGGSGKDDRRWAITSGYCVIALVGDQLGDFSDLFNAADMTPSRRRALSLSPQFAKLWGNGWFLLPNPVYGTALKGGFDEIFPIDMRWKDPAEGAK